jgi:hypothetical protein
MWLRRYRTGQRLVFAGCGQSKEGLATREQRSARSSDQSPRPRAGAALLPRRDLPPMMNDVSFAAALATAEFDTLVGWR